MAVKKGILDNFLKPDSIYSSNQKNLRSIFIDEDNYSNDTFVENCNQNSNQLVTNKESISNQLVPDIGNQLVTNKESIGNHSKKHVDHKEINKESIGKPIGNRNKESIGNQLVTTNDLVSKTNGIQRKILFCIVDDCVFRGRLVSGFISNEMLREITKTTAKTVKTATQRLVKKGLIKREKGKCGKGGFCSFVVTENVRDMVLKEKRNT